MIGGGYRSQRITTAEIRFNPMKRNRGGERDLDHIIMAAVRGLDRASLEYPQVRAGILLMMDRTFDERQNAIIVEKAIRYASRGIVGVDIAGPRLEPGPYPYRDLAPLVQAARDAGLGVTVHVGEEGFPEEIAEVVETLQPDRIGHGVLAARDPELTALLAARGTVLEICPTSNLLTKALADVDAVRETFRTFLDAGVRVTVSTDGPEMMRDPPARRVRVPLPHRCADRRRGQRGERSGARLVVRPSAGRRRSADGRGAARRGPPAPTQRALVAHPGLRQPQPEALDHGRPARPRRRPLPPAPPRRRRTTTSTCSSRCERQRSRPLVLRST